jgi:hypothetical protein
VENNKTCGECQWYDYHHLLCVVGGDVATTDCACDSFIPIKHTNGDVIRQMSNEELLRVFEESCGKFSSREEFLDWLNAPAESEGE